MGKYDQLIGQPAYRTKNSNLDYKVGKIERDPFPLFSPLILRFNDKKGIRCKPKDIVVIDENGKDLGRGTKFLR